MHESLDNLWLSIVKPLFEAVGVRMIVEVGCADGRNTRHLLSYAKALGGTVSVIDPSPGFDVTEWQSKFPDTLILHRETSLDALPKITITYDSVVIDGDHNWYTVMHELLLIEKHAAVSGMFPLIILHDIGWPYGRRDAYAEPERIPDSFRQPSLRKGIVPISHMLQDDGGLNPSVLHAVSEHADRNGVLTAVEDFLALSTFSLEFIALPGFFGTGILVDKNVVDQNAALRSYLADLVLPKPISRHVEALEQARVETIVSGLNRERECTRVSGMLRDAMHLVRFFRFIQSSLLQEVQDMSIDLQRIQNPRSWRITTFLRRMESKICGLLRWSRKIETPTSSRDGISLSSGRDSSCSLIGCTIVSRNFLAQARVLAMSFRKHHPDAEFIVLLVDPVGDQIDLSNEPFTVFPIQNLLLPDRDQLFFRYGVRELHTAVKPFFLQRIFDDKHPDHLFYLDPDILVTGPLHAAMDALSSHNIVLTPHILKPIESKFRPSETDVLRVGVYNLGFIGLSATRVTTDFLHWWQHRVVDDCTEQPDKCIFFDQRWMDLSPGLFPDVHILRDPAYNVAYWNVHERKVERINDAFLVNGAPLVFFHFSGYQPERSDILCKYHHHDRDFGSYPGLRRLFDHYRALLISQEYERVSKVSYHYSCFENGVRIPTFIRRHYGSLSAHERLRYANPFLTGDGSYWCWLLEPRVFLQSGGSLTNAHEVFHLSSADICSAFPQLDDRFASWILEREGSDRLPEEFLSSLQAMRSSHGSTRLRRFFLRRNAFPLYRFLVKIARFVFPSQLFSRIRAMLSLRDLGGLPGRVNIRIHKPFGINMLGYFTAGSGLGQAVRLHALAAEAAHVPLAIHNILAAGLPQIPFDRGDGFSSQCPYGTTILHVNADQVASCVRSIPFSAMQSEKLIGYWAWELSEFPRELSVAAKQFDEIWTPTTFSANAIQSQVSCPVYVVPHPIVVGDTSTHAREDFGIRSDHFVFLFTFDCLSVVERKNPFAVIDAFARAFRNNEHVELVLKFSNGDRDPLLRSRLIERAAGQNILLLDIFLSTEATHDLLRCCDAYVSLHRTEGFGLAMAEAMFLGKPVIATNYSGNTDFMTRENSILIDYSLLPLDRDYGPYRKGNVWADPDLDQAVAAMRRLWEDRCCARDLGMRAAFDIRQSLSPSRIGNCMRERIAGV
ncbi:glycosyltransferase [Candidatus Peribacteria bacterium]|nr:glycosyltransferase [Candidatus Peribacteria bacterium]